MSQWEVLTGLRQLAPLTEEEADSVLPLCLSSLEEIKIRLKNGVNPNDMRIINAAVGLAYYKLTIRQLAGEDSITSFKAGDITVSKSSTAALEIACSVRDEGLKAALPLLIDNEFVFRQVGV